VKPTACPFLFVSQSCSTVRKSIQYFLFCYMVVILLASQEFIAFINMFSIYVIGRKEKKKGFLFSNLSLLKSCKPSTLFWALIALGAGFALVLVLLLVMKNTKSRMDQQEKLAKEKETASLIPKPLPGPIYGGY
jgi:hypothetical protein